MNIQDIKHLAHLSRLHISDKEVEEYAKQFDEIVAYVDKIKEVSTHDEISGQAQDDSAHTRDDIPVNVLREDEVSSYPDPEQIIDEAPHHQDNFVKVKKILQQ